MGPLNVIIRLGIIAGMIFLPLIWLHERRRKAAAGALHLSVALPQWRVWTMAGDLVFVVAVAGPLLLLGAEWAEMLVLETSQSSDFLMLAMAILIFRMLDRRPIFAPATIEFREAGISHLGGLLPWDQMKSYSWSGEPSATLHVKSAGQIGSYRLDPKRKDEVEALLKQKIPAQPKVQPSSAQPPQKADA